MPIIIFIAAIALATLGGAMYFKSPDTPLAEPNESGISNMLDDAEDAAEQMEQGIGGGTEETTPTPVRASLYQNGAYTKTGTYRSPAGNESFTMSVTLADGVVASVTFTGAATNPTSVSFQDAFAAEYSDAVVGKNLSDIDLTVVNGASLTTAGFMDALAAVKTDATS
jgi:hypothetical protein